MIGVPGIAHRLFGAIQQTGISVTLIAQARHHCTSSLVPLLGSGSFPGDAVCVWMGHGGLNADALLLLSTIQQASSEQSISFATKMNDAEAAKAGTSVSRPPNRTSFRC